MFKLTTVETYRADTKEEAEQFIREEREKGVQNGYDVSQAAYKHYDKKAKNEIVDSCEVVSITKVFAGKWDA
nr:MAG TPA: hypothetical protein [Caudoviricetes sp.]